MRNICIQLAYDGSNFSGWQMQASQRSVQAEVESGLGRLHGQNVGVSSAGRTDSGVHASAQVANFVSSLDGIPDYKYAAALNRYLPHDVRVIQSFAVHDTFHATRDAVQRRYRYYMYVADTANPLLDRFRLRVREYPDIRVMNSMAMQLVGTKNFSSLASRKDEKSMVRTVHSAVFFPDQYGIVFEIAGQGFLWKMVRTIVGTILALYPQRHAAQEFARILAAEDRQCGGKTASPRGLVLSGVQYPWFSLPEGRMEKYE